MNGADNITVSRDALRAELAEMELRLIERLVSRSSFDDLVLSHTELSALVVAKIAWAEGLMLARDRLIAEHEVLMKEHGEKIAGGFTKAQVLTLANLIDESTSNDRNTMWVYRRNWVAVLALLVSVASVLVFALR